MITTTAERQPGEAHVERIRYGLTTPLRPFTIPDWTGSCELLLSDDLHALGEHVQVRNDFLATRHAGVERTLSIPVGTRGTVKLTRVLSGDSAMHLAIHVGPGCDITFEDEYQGPGSAAHSTVLVVAPGSVVRYAILQDLPRERLALLHYEVRVQDAQLTWFFCGLGADTTQASLETTALEGADIRTTAAILGTGKQQFDLHATTRHEGPGTKSDMLVRAVLDDTSRVFSHGLIRIDERARDSDSYEKTEVILLSERAGADAIPNLEIHNHRVRCTHGATIGKLDEEKLFYLRTRGIPEAEAKRMITEGFLEPLFIAPWHHLIHERISRSS